MVNLNINPRVREKLEALLTYLYDSQKGYKECARVTQAEGLKSVFISEANQRLAMIRTIQKQLQYLTRQMTLLNSFMVAGPIHRLYLNLKDLLIKGDSTRLLKEIKRGDSKIAHSYEEVLREDLPADLDQTLHAQLKHFNDTIRDLSKLNH